MMTFQDFLSQCLCVICTSKPLLFMPLSYIGPSGLVGELRRGFRVLAEHWCCSCHFFFESCPCFSFVELDWIGHWTVELSQAKYDDDKDSFFTRQTLSGIVIVRLRCAKTCGHCQSVFADWFVILCCLCSSWQVDLLSSWFVFLVCLWVWLLRQAVPLTPLLTCQWWTKKLSGILSSRDMGILAILSSIQHVGRRTFWGLCTIEW